MPVEITMPRLSDTMEEGTLVKWHVKVGDSVSSGDHLADVETDKATMELQTFDDGTVARIDVAEGRTVPVGNLILVLAEEGESVEDAAGSGASAKTEPAPKAKAESAGGSDEPTDTGGSTATLTEAAPGGGRVRISPLARKLADEHGVDIRQVAGTGPDSRIIKRDILAQVEHGAAKPAKRVERPTEAPAAAPPARIEPVKPTAVPLLPSGPGIEVRTIELSSMRKTIARRLVESKTTIPHFQVSVAVNMDPLLELRGTLNAQLGRDGIKLSVNDFVSRAAALALVAHPIANSSFQGDSVVVHGTVNLGIAVALPLERGGGLIVPVIRDAHLKGLRQLSAETRALAAKARESGLSAEEMADGTFTISNLGMYGVEEFNAIINPPQVAILAVGGANQKPVVRDGQLVVGHEMNLTLSADHRVLDGALAAEFLTRIRELLENPAALMV